MSNRYVAIEGSQSGHCCFEATVIDTQKPEIFNGKHYNNRYEAICECLDLDQAKEIAHAMNKGQNHDPA